MENETETETKTIVVDADLHLRLKFYALENNLQLGDAANNALRQFLGLERKRKP